MEKLSNENKKVFLIGDFNVGLMKIDINVDTANFFDVITSNLLVPHIIHPTRITPTPKTLIDNIYSNSVLFPDGISGNLSISISDHLAQFFIIPENYEYVSKKQNTYKRDTKNFDRENFILDLLSIDWSTIINLESDNPSHSYNLFETKLTALVDKYMPIRKLTKNELKHQQKPWITKGIRKSIQRREILHKKFIKAKSQEIKDEYHKEYKDLRNKIVTLCRLSKHSYYQTYFIENANNAKSTWKGIKSIINIRSTVKHQPSSLMVNNEITSDPKVVATTFNNYFSSIGKELQGQIYHNGHDFTKYLKNRNEHSFFYLSN